jgi:UDP-N-acetylmuramoyl-tripeptide--D-alanyl-D-alanine ligase
MNLIIYSLLFLFALLYSKATLFWVFLWQLKEYRLDRFWAEYGFWGKLLHFWAFSGGRKFHRPVFTLKALAIYVVSLLVVLAGIYAVLRLSIFSFFDSVWIIFLGLSILYVLIPAIVLAIMAIFQAPIILAKFFIYKMAAARIAENKNLIVIGITGSYGKTSTKEFLAQILEQKFKIIRTPKNINTEIGIAKFILQNLAPALSLERRGGKEVFIVEMGAYKKGEIKRICDIVKPKIGIITGINEQHLSLFGSFQDIIDTKYELIEGLPKDGLALFNGENEYSLKMAKKWQGKKVIYRDANILMHANDANMPRHYRQNLAGAVEIAKHLGMSEEEIKQAIGQIKLTDRMIKTFIGKNGTLVIDDSYSANPDGVLAGLDYLAEQQQKRKIIIMLCLIELGNSAKEVHRKIGQKINAICDLAIITTKDYFDVIKAETGEKAVLVVTPEKAIKLLKLYLDENTAVLIEGRVAESVIGFLK